MIDLRPAPAPIRQSGTVEARIGRLHRVLLDGGQYAQADSTVAYPPGARVTLLADVIVGTGGPAPQTTSYQE